MLIGNVQVCNICLKNSEDEPEAVFIKAVARGENVHVCTGCIPVIIHGDSNAIKSNAQVRLEIKK